jgi:NAD(P)-dependent dehydrogenase (short-subunit alcohol dehydrogenase family)
MIRRGRFRGAAQARAAAAFRRPEEIAAAAVFLASDEASSIAGVVLKNGGALAPAGT